MRGDYDVAEDVRRMAERDAAELADLQPHKMKCTYRGGCGFVASATMTILACTAMMHHLDRHFMETDPDWLRRVEGL